MATFYVKYFSPNCTLSRKVLFVINGAVPYTIISPYVAKDLRQDCNITEDGSDTLIKINVREVEARVYKHHLYGVNLLGMEWTS